MTQTFDAITPPGDGGVARPTIDVILDRPPSAAWYGLTPGCTDAAGKLQKAANAQNSLFIQPGNYQFDGPVLFQPGATVIGGGMLKTRIQRRGVWLGDTFQCGTADHLQFAGDCLFSDMLMEQLHPGYTIGTSLTMTDKLTDGQSHLSLYSGVHARVERIWFEHGVYGVSLFGCTAPKIKSCNSRGSWDTRNAAVSETIASIRVGQNQAITPFKYNTEVHISDGCYLGTGGPSPRRDITVGSVVFSDPTLFENIGPKYGVLVQGTEGISIRSSYIGGCGMNCIAFDPQGLVAKVRMDDLFLDECFDAQIRFGAGPQAVNGVTIGSSMNCNGQTRARQAIRSDFNSSIAGNFSVMSLNITGGVYENYLETGMLLLGVGTGKVDAQIRAFNCKGGNYDRADIASSVYVGQASRWVIVDGGGPHGGGINNGPGNHAKWGPYFEQSYNGFAANIRALRDGTLGGTDVGGGVSQTYPT